MCENGRNETFKWLQRHRIEVLYKYIQPLEKDDLLHLSESELKQLCKEFKDTNMALQLKFVAVVRRDKEEMIKKNKKEKYDWQAKQIDDAINIVFLGESGVGKSSIIRRYTKNTFFHDSKSTSEIDIDSKTLILSDGSNVLLKIWDTAGQENHDSENIFPLKQADCIIIVYDISNIKSYQIIESKYKNMIKEYCRSHVYVMVVGNKEDLRTFDRDSYTFNTSEASAASVAPAAFAKNSHPHDEHKESLIFGSNVDSVISDNDGESEISEMAYHGGKVNMMDMIKKDKNDELKLVSLKNAAAMALGNQWGFAEASAKSNHQIDTLFKSCAEYGFMQRNIFELKHKTCGQVINDTNVAGIDRTGTHESTRCC